MGNFLKALRLMPQALLDWHDRQKDEERLMDKCEKVIESFNGLRLDAANRDNEIQLIKADVKEMKEMVSTLSIKLGATQEGVKKELGETLHQWHELGVKRGWMSKAEKDEITEIYNIYCKRLNGNGIGQFYYEDLIKLPEKEE